MSRCCKLIARSLYDRQPRSQLTSSVAERKGQCEEHVAEHAAALTESIRALRQAPSAAWQARATGAAARKPGVLAHLESTRDL